MPSTYRSIVAHLSLLVLTACSGAATAEQGAHGGATGVPRHDEQMLWDLYDQLDGRGYHLPFSDRHDFTSWMSSQHTGRWGELLQFGAELEGNSPAIFNGYRPSDEVIAVAGEDLWSQLDNEERYRAFRYDPAHYWNDLVGRDDLPVVFNHRLHSDRDDRLWEVKLASHVETLAELYSLAMYGIAQFDPMHLHFHTSFFLPRDVTSEEEELLLDFFFQANDYIWLKNLYEARQYDEGVAHDPFSKFTGHVARSREEVRSAFFSRGEEEKHYGFGLRGAKRFEQISCANDGNKEHPYTRGRAGFELRKLYDPVDAFGFLIQAVLFLEDPERPVRFGVSGQPYALLSTRFFTRPQPTLERPPQAYPAEDELLRQLHNGDIAEALRVYGTKDRDRAIGRLSTPYVPWEERIELLKPPDPRAAQGAIQAARPNYAACVQRAIDNEELQWNERRLALGSCLYEWAEATGVHRWQ